MKFRSLLLTFTLITGAYGSRMVFAEEEGASTPSASAASDADDEGEPQAATANAGDDNIVDEPLKEPARSPRKQNVRRSRLTKDLTEAQADRRRLAIGVAEDKIIDLDFDIYAGEPWSINSNGKAVGVQRIKTDASGGRRMVFRGTTKGDATISVFDANQKVRLIFLVTVTEKSLVRKMDELKELFRDIEGIEIKIIGEKIVVDGDVLVLQDYGRIVSVLADESYSKMVINLVGISPVSLAGIAREIKRQVNTFAPNVTTRVVNGYIFLEGTVDNLTQVKRVEDVADTYLALPENRLVSPIVRKEESAAQVQSKFRKTFIVVAEPPPRGQDKLVRITVHFVELFKDYNKFFGFRWNPGFTSAPSLSFGQQNDGNLGTNSSTFSATLSNLFPKLNTLQSSGFGRILKQFVMIGKNGTAISTGEERKVYSTVAGATGAAVQNNVGADTTISITPRIFKQTEDVEMAIQFKKTDFESGSNSVTLTKNYNGTVFVRSNESAALSASDVSQASTAFNRGPANDTGTEGTEAIFNLNRSKNFVKSKGQMVIFVTPQIIENASDGSEDLKKNFRIKVK